MLIDLTQMPLFRTWLAPVHSKLLRGLLVLCLGGLSLLEAENYTYFQFNLYILYILVYYKLQLNINWHYQSLNQGSCQSVNNYSRQCYEQFERISLYSFKVAVFALLQSLHIITSPKIPCFSISYPKWRSPTSSLVQVVITLFSQAKQYLVRGEAKQNGSPRWMAPNTKLSLVLYDHAPLCEEQHGTSKPNTSCGLPLKLLNSSKPIEGPSTSALPFLSIPASWQVMFRNLPIKMNWSRALQAARQHLQLFSKFSSIAFSALLASQIGKSEPQEQKSFSQASNSQQNVGSFLSMVQTKQYRTQFKN
ncbi:hypothetical protein FGO68_gene14907 [Halteria grandinella]|uniref:Uncharacterized protein n=1 Tax=Halteria grandinella TaxID=5974 RepID=A0A8J8NG46_HALGN|nr:hypothetical protein FGO68_gene14907 [Halteria grandinella]